MDSTHIAEIEVRGYELDSYGHVNHAVYFNYLEHARWKFFLDQGFTRASFQEWKAWPVIANVEASYLLPCFMGDKLTVQTQVIERTRSSYILSQEIFRGDAPVFRAKLRSVTVNEKGRPTPIPAALEALLGITPA